MKNYSLTNQLFIKLVVRWKIYFYSVTLASLVLSAIFSSSFFIAPKYKSYTLLYPSNIISYSSETPSEQLIQLLESGDIRDAIIHKFNLAEHYNIDTTEETGKSTLIKTYKSNIEIKRTQYNSISIEVLDTDPLLASKMVEEIINSLNLKARSLQRQKTAEVVTIYKNLMNSKKQQVDSIDAILQEFRVKYQLLDYEIQTKEVTKSYFKAISSGARKENLKDIDLMLRNLEEKGGEYYNTKQTLDVVLKSYNEAKLEYDKAISDLNKELTYTNIISKPFPADEKTYPIRWIIVLISVVSANLFLFCLLIITKKPDLDKLSVSENNANK